MARKQISRLPVDIEEKALDLVLEGKRMAEIAKAIGLDSRAQLQRYMAKFPEFHAEVQKARILEAESIEEEFRHLMDKYSTDAAKVQMEIYTRYLKWVNRERYGDKYVAEINVNVDMSKVLEAAEARVITSRNVIEIGSSDED